MDFNFWVTLEWTGAIIALLGSFFMASHKVKPVYCWILWLLCNVCFIFYFSHHNQLGLLLMHVGGLFINSFGLYQWLQHEQNINQKVTKLLIAFTILFFAISIYYTILFAMEPNIKYAEWIGSMTGLTASFLLASRHKYSFLCWFVWSISNLILLAVTIITEQYGVVFLQTGFMISNVYGSITWVKKYLATHKIQPVEEQLHP